LNAYATLARLGLVDQTGVQIGVDRHLLARHGIEGKTRRHFGDAGGALGDNNEIDDDQNNKDKKPTA
jgi:hypothetical protein